MKLSDLLNVLFKITINKEQRAESASSGAPGPSPACEMTVRLPACYCNPESCPEPGTLQPSKKSGWMGGWMDVQMDRLRDGWMNKAADLGYLGLPNVSPVA